MANNLRALVSAIGLSILFFLLLSAQTAFAADITVDATCTLPDAITSANADAATGSCPAGSGADVIHLSSDITLDAELPQITSDITIEGGGFTISGDNSFRIFYVVGGKLAIRELTLTEGRAESGGAVKSEGVLNVSGSSFSNNAAEYGGAIISNGALSIIDSTFINNQAEWIGGAIKSHDALNITGSSFAYNSATKLSGGAIANYGALYITDSRFAGNETAMFGGAISNSHELSITDSTFTDNSTDSCCGGAINNFSAKLSIVDCTFSGNSAAENGGAIDNYTHHDGDLAQLFVNGSTFTGNRASRNGGAIISSGELKLVSSSFTNNSAERSGGALASYNALSATNSTFSSNIGQERGGGLLIFSPETTTLVHLTVANNLSREGGGIYADQMPDESELNLRNSIFIGNEGGDCVAKQLSANVENLIADGSCDPALSGDPKLGTLVEPEDGSPAYYSLQPDSPAIDAADPDFCAETDQTSTPRPQGDACDIGAVEFKGE